MSSKGLLTNGPERQHQGSWLSFALSSGVDWMPRVSPSHYHCSASYFTCVSRQDSWLTQSTDGLLHWTIPNIYHREFLFTLHEWKSNFNFGWLMSHFLYHLGPGLFLLSYFQLVSCLLSSCQRVDKRNKNWNRSIWLFDSGPDERCVGRGY